MQSPIVNLSNHQEIKLELTLSLLNDRDMSIKTFKYLVSLELEALEIITLKQILTLKF